MATKQDLYKVAWFVGTVVILLFALESIWFFELGSFVYMAAAILLFAASDLYRKNFFAGYLSFMALEIAFLGILYGLKAELHGLEIFIFSLCAFSSWLYAGARQVTMLNGRYGSDLFWKYFVSVMSFVAFNLFAMLLCMQLHPK